MRYTITKEFLEYYAGMEYLWKERGFELDGVCVVCTYKDSRYYKVYVEGNSKYALVQEHLLKLLGEVKPINLEDML